MDPNAQWWTDAEINGYIGHWQDRLQDELEFVWGTATVTSSLATLTLTDVASDILRLDGIWWNNKHLSARSKEELDILDRNWRNANTATPYVSYQDDDTTVSFWPPPSSAGTLIFEYPKDLSFATSTSTMGLPAWSRYSCLNYCAMRAYGRFGPNQDASRAARYKAKFVRQLRRYVTLKANYWPDKYLVLRPAGRYEKEILQPEPPQTGAVVPGTIQRTTWVHEVPTGTVNGVNATFTLSQTPNPTTSVMLIVDGLEMKQGTHYTLSGTTITFVTAYIPVTGQYIFAHYEYYG
jgi:hypothetical protein